jgi:hypothetical protein
MFQTRTSPCQVGSNRRHSHSEIQNGHDSVGEAGRHPVPILGPTYLQHAVQLSLTCRVFSAYLAVPRPVIGVMRLPNAANTSA